MGKFNEIIARWQQVMQAKTETDKRLHKKVIIRGLCGALVVAMLTTSVVLTIKIVKKPDKILSNGGDLTDSSGSLGALIGDTEIEPPSKTLQTWYKPGQIKFLNVSGVDQVKGDFGNDYEHIPHKIDGHKDCYFSYKLRSTQEIVCMDHTVRAEFANSGIAKSTDAVVLQNANPKTQKAIVYLHRNQRVYGHYIYSPTFKNKIEKLDDRYKNVPDYFPSIDFDSVLCYEKDWFLLDTTGEKIVIKNITNGRSASNKTQGGMYSPDGKYAIIKVVADDGRFYDGAYENWLLFDIKGATSHIGQGKILHFFDNETKVVVEGKQNARVVDIKSGKDVTSEVEIPQGLKYKLVQKNNKNKNHSKVKLVLEPVFSGLSEIVLEPGIDCHIRSGDYLYTYKHKDSFIKCYSFENQSSFKINVDQSFLNEAIELEKTKRVIYHMNLNINNTGIALFKAGDFYVPEDQNKPVEEDLRSDIERIAREFENADCFAQMKGKFEEIVQGGRGTAYKGDGFLYCSFKIEHGGYVSIVEDYRDRTFTMYQHINGFEYVAFEINSYPSPAENYRKKLSSTANMDDSLTLLKRFNVYDPIFDYAKFYTDNKVDQQKIRKHMLSQDYYYKYCKTNFFYNFVDKRDYGQSETTLVGMDLKADKSAEKSLFDALGIISNYNLDLKTKNIIEKDNFVQSALEAKGIYEFAMAFENRDNTTNIMNIFIGKANGKYFVADKIGAAYISKEDYDKIMVSIREIDKQSYQYFKDNFMDKNNNVDSSHLTSSDINSSKSENECNESSCTSCYQSSSR